MAKIWVPDVSVEFGGSYGPNQIVSAKVSIDEDGNGASCQVTLRDVQGAFSGLQLSSSGSGAGASFGALQSLQNQPLVQFSTGTEIVVSIGGQSWNFIHTATQYSFGPPGIFTITGSGCKWVLSRDNLNGSYKNIDFFTLAYRLASQFGVEVRLLSGDNPTYSSIDITGLSAFGLISRETKEMGLYTREDGATLLIYDPSYSAGSYNVQRKNFSGNFQVNFVARAQNDQSQGQEKSLPGNVPEENRSQVDRYTGDQIVASNGEVQPQNDELQFGAQRKRATGIVDQSSMEQEKGRTETSPGTALQDSIKKKLEKQKSKDITASYSFAPINDESAFSIVPSYKISFDGSIPLGVPSSDWRVGNVSISWAGSTKIDLELFKTIE